MVNFFGPANTLGTGIHCYNLAKAYEDLGNEVCLIPPMGQVRFEDENVRRWLKNREKFDKSNPSLMIFDIHWLAQFCGTPRIGFAVFETDGFTPIQKAAMRSCDSLLVPSEWGKSVLRDNGLEASVVPEGFSPTEFTLDLLPRGPEEIFRIVHVGKFEERKGTIQAIRCFFRALEREDAELVMHCENPFLTGSGFEQVTQELRKLGFEPAGFQSGRQPSVFKRMGLRVVLSGHTESIAHLYRSADVGIFPSKGEGWGLPIMECVASGTPVIAGKWTGQSEFLRDDYPENLTIQAPRKEMANDGTWYFGDRGSWNAPRDEELVEIIRWAFENARPLKSSPGWADIVLDIRRDFTWRRAAEKLQQFLGQAVEAKIK